MRIIQAFIFFALSLSANASVAATAVPKEKYHGPGDYDARGHWDGGHPYSGVTVDDDGRPHPHYTDGHMGFTPANPDPGLERIIVNQILAGGEDA